jgi:hypothetical protein
VLFLNAFALRLISNIVDLDKADQNKLTELIDYIAFDKFDSDKELCKSALINTYGDCDNRYFNDIDSLTTKYDKGTFDVVIMCNVLHEIDPKHWLNLFKLEGEISSLLKENGIIMLVEDQHIPIGEKAYVNGFLVLDTPHLKELFQITEQDLDFKYDSQRNGRLKAHFIPKSCLIRISNDSITKSIKTVCETAKRQILALRQETTYKSGNLHGFWTQQFANAQLILDERTKE